MVYGGQGMVFKSYMLNFIFFPL
uniref:Uncharacterized protein n=1 Tax=Rhizophora mucronata TaxID=61149 RepID=A0A2P2PVG8_RHIMU